MLVDRKVPGGSYVPEPQETRAGGIPGAQRRQLGAVATVIGWSPAGEFDSQLEEAQGMNTCPYSSLAQSSSRPPYWPNSTQS